MYAQPLTMKVVAITLAILMLASAPSSAWHNEDNTSCVAIPEYCVTVTFTDLSFACHDTADAFACQLQGTALAVATGPDYLGGALESELYGHVSGCAEVCANVNHGEYPSCTWEAGEGGCQVERQLSVVWHADTRPTECKFITASAFLRARTYEPTLGTLDSPVVFRAQESTGGQDFMTRHCP